MTKILTKWKGQKKLLIQRVVMKYENMLFWLTLSRRPSSHWTFFGRTLQLLLRQPLQRCSSIQHSSCYIIWLYKRFIFSFPLYGLIFIKAGICCCSNSQNDCYLSHPSIVRISFLYSHLLTLERQARFLDYSEPIRLAQGIFASLKLEETYLKIATTFLTFILML